MTRAHMAAYGREAAAHALLGRDADAAQMGLEDYDTGLVDVLTNLMHFADRYNVSFEEQLARAYMHHEAEGAFDWDEETA